MKEQVLKILELCFKLKEEKGYDIFFHYSPHVDMVTLNHSKTLKWENHVNNHFYCKTLYVFGELYSPEKTEEVIKHLESL